jgi:8-oxo-dGTP pyrophosphatase MutT (NUDIX family)
MKAVICINKANLMKLLEKYYPNDIFEKSYKSKILEFISNNQVVFGKENRRGHITGSSWVINKSKNKVLLCYHRKLDKWLQFGGHSDDNEDVLDTALREATEESGLESLKLLSEEIFDVDIHSIPMIGDENEHIHYDIRFVFEADERENIRISNESKDIAWIDLENVKNFNCSASLLRMIEKTKYYIVIGEGVNDC